MTEVPSVSCAAAFGRSLAPTDDGESGGTVQQAFAAGLLTPFAMRRRCPWSARRRHASELWLQRARPMARLSTPFHLACAVFPPRSSAPRFTCPNRVATWTTKRRAVSNGFHRPFLSAKHFSHLSYIHVVCPPAVRVGVTVSPRDGLPSPRRVPSFSILVSTRAGEAKVFEVRDQRIAA